MNTIDMQQFFNERKKLYIGVDFDGTCVRHEYPKVGADIGAVPVLQDLQMRGHKLILNTMRGEDTIGDAVNWFLDNGLKLYGINVNPDQGQWTNSPKVYANVYIDDCSLGIPLIDNGQDRPYVDWEKVKDLLEERNII